MNHAVVLFLKELVNIFDDFPKLFRTRVENHFSNVHFINVSLVLVDCDTCLT